MASEAPQKTDPTRMASRTKTRTHRERLRAQGLRPIQLWVPDIRTAAFRAEAERQARQVAESEHAGDDQAFIDAIAIDWPEE